MIETAQALGGLLWGPLRADSFIHLLERELDGLMLCGLGSCPDEGQAIGAVRYAINGMGGHSIPFPGGTFDRMVGQLTCHKEGVNERGTHATNLTEVRMLREDQAGQGR